MAALASTPAFPLQPAPAHEGVPVKPAPRPSHGTPSGRIRSLAKWIAPILAAGAIAAGARTVGSRAATPVRYETAAIDHGRIDAKVTATGTVSALVTVLVGSQVSGRIESLAVDYGSTVKTGQVIATIDPALFRAAAEQARANHAAALANIEKARAQEIEAGRQYARAQALHGEGLASRADLDVAEANARVARAQVRAAEAQAAQAKAALDQASLNLRYSTIVSPIDGVVISRNVDVGQTVAATLQAPTLFTIAQDLGQMQVDTSVAEADVGKIRAGMDVTFTVDAYPGRPFGGRVRQVRDAAQTVQNVVTYDAVIDVSNGEHLLKPGMTASVTFVYAQKADVLRVPNGALRFRPDAATTAAMTGSAAAPAKGAPARRPLELAADERALWVLREGRPVAEKVRVGLTDGTITEVVAGGVRAGDVAITEAVVDASAAKRP
ncbi:MAG: efflux RND transporter periplasmic adaptor subunit [Minicystis sp.]